ncbi:riboflavin synthase [Sphingomonas nostoxanthinifaciens]|uniref:riboflavin synthase n=1 Tax=Sphingomonas nostoxanthinifaciens TaxID=2872652 RepID=UPI001CC1CDF5|nr:riboflavin synthase [Sphingomonas nostoxanthinifaciens]UAK24816.1 riboflavin synthase [Sphingomonas nostoxanthinifaciens]
MFTGIITDLGRIAAVEQRGDLRLRIATRYDVASIDLGASIACSGVCLTVVDKGDDWFAVDVSAETLSRTAGDWREGLALNLERALRVGDELGGHIVTGHVDGVGTVVAVAAEGDSTRITIEAPAALAAYIAPKGSIALDGVSLTVNEVADMPGGTARFGINLIPHTAEMTTFGAVEPGRAINIEIDVLARYLGRMEQLRVRPS